MVYLSRADTATRQEGETWPRSPDYISSVVGPVDLGAFAPMRAQLAKPLQPYMWRLPCHLERRFNDISPQLSVSARQSRPCKKKLLCLYMRY